MEHVLHIEFTPRAAAAIGDESNLAEADLLGFAPAVGDIVLTRGWPGNDVVALQCSSRRVDLSRAGEFHIHVELDMAPQA